MLHKSCQQNSPYDACHELRRCNVTQTAAKLDLQVDWSFKRRWESRRYIIAAVLSTFQCPTGGGWYANRYTDQTSSARPVHGGVSATTVESERNEASIVERADVTLRNSAPARAMETTQLLPLPQAAAATSAITSDAAVRAAVGAAVSAAVRAPASPLDPLDRCTMASATDALPPMAAATTQ